MSSLLTSNVENTDVSTGMKLKEVVKHFMDFILKFTPDSDATDKSLQQESLDSATSRGALPSSSNLGAENTFLAKKSEKKHKLSYYLRKLESALNQGESYCMLKINFEHLQDFSEYLATTLETEFASLELSLSNVLLSISEKYFPDSISHHNAEGVRNRRFGLSIYNVGPASGLRQLDATKTGQLSVLSGVVTRTSDIRPELIEGTFLCLICGQEIPAVRQEYRFVIPKKCTRRSNEGLNTSSCQNTDYFRLVVRKSVFADWQRIFIQEHTSEIPAGSMPRSIEVVLRDSLVDRVKPGDRAEFTGTLLAIPDVAVLYSDREVTKAARGGFRKDELTGLSGKSGFRQTGSRTLSHKLIFVAYSVKALRSYAGYSSADTPAYEDSDCSLGSDDNDRSGDAAESEAQTKASVVRFEDRQATEEYRERILASLAPDIFGHEEIKKGLLLMLLGGVEKKTFEGINLRGNINILLVGDPSTAKSRFLKAIQQKSRRSVYTSGKGSSAAGLTASVVKDEDGGDFVVQAGAMMLADHGVCCIDEFDKMELSDQSAIHEAMEQQTITITKAGVHATMNAATSVLAACNSSFGRYDKSKPLSRNIDISPAILSRFDLVFVLVDDCDDEFDKAVASRIVSSRKKHLTLSEEDSEEFCESDKEPSRTSRKGAGSLSAVPESEFVRFMENASKIRPEITVEARKAITATYRFMRENDSVSVHSNKTTIRQLESLIRLSEAVAKFQLSTEVTKQHVAEAAKLLRTSIQMVRKKEIILTPETFKETSNDSGNDLTAPGKEEKAMLPKISFEEYNRICSGITLLLQSERCSKTSDELVQWYVKELEKRNKLKGIDEAKEAIHIVKLVIERLATVDHILVKEQAEAGVRYGLNPNFDVSENPADILDTECKRVKSPVKKRNVRRQKNREESDVYDFDA